MRTYKWGWEDNSWPHFSVDVPEGTELAIATTEYQVQDHIGPVPFTAVRVVTVKLVFIDPQEDAQEIKELSFAPGALKLIDKERTP